jgi:DNA-directed RNA polymerase subunit RPC12/RpoP
VFWSTCSSCGHQFCVADENAGLELPCPHCKTRAVYQPTPQADRGGAVRRDAAHGGGFRDEHEDFDGDGGIEIVEPGSADDVTPPHSLPGGAIHVAHGHDEEAHAPVDLGGEPVTGPLRRRTHRRLGGAWMGVPAALLIVGVGYLVHLAIETGLLSEVAEESSETGVEAVRDDRAAQYGRDRSMLPTSSVSGESVPAEPEPETKSVVADVGTVYDAEPTVWDGFNGVRWMARASNLDGLTSAGDLGTIFEADMKWYVRENELRRFAGAPVDAIYYGFLNGKFCEARLVSGSPKKVLAWIEQRYGPSNEESHIEGVLRWRGESSGGRTVVVEYAERSAALPATMRMTVEGVL